MVGVYNLPPRKGISAPQRNKDRVPHSLRGGWRREFAFYSRSKTSCGIGGTGGRCSRYNDQSKWGTLPPSIGSIYLRKVWDTMSLNP